MDTSCRESELVLGVSEYAVEPCCLGRQPGRAECSEESVERVDNLLSRRETIGVTIPVDLVLASADHVHHQA